MSKKRGQKGENRRLIETGVSMEKIFISNLNIEKVRHLKGISIPLSNEKIKHLIFTGKNGSGKTSVLEALSWYLNTVIAEGKSAADLARLGAYATKLAELQAGCVEILEAPEKAEEGREFFRRRDWTSKITFDLNESDKFAKNCYEKGELILAYYRAERFFRAELPKHVEKVELKDYYAVTETPRQLFVKYLLDLKVTEALARNSGKYEKADDIEQWFVKFQELLRKVFEDQTLELVFEEDTFSFLIKEKEKELFDFNSMSGGFAAVLDIVLDLIIRMEKATQRSFDFAVPGIVLIDELETHLHLELQKNILNLLTTVFPNIQFIVSTHSPFVLNSLQNVVIYDLEKRIAVKDGLSDIPYGGIVEGYFRSDEMSASLKDKFERYKILVKKAELSDDDFEEIAELELFLNEIPDYLALNVTTEYQRLKIEFESREDV